MMGMKYSFDARLELARKLSASFQTRIRISQGSENGLRSCWLAFSRRCQLTELEDVTDLDWHRRCRIIFRFWAHYHRLFDAL
jgi:hypothetical protein